MGGYTVEEAFGAALRGAPALRERLQLITKCDIKLVHDRRPAHRRHVYDTSAEHIIASAENSLKVLGTDHLDVLLLHRQDPLMDPDEVAAAFASLQQSGKVLAFGVSNFTPSHLSMLQSRWLDPLVTNQIEVSVLRLDPFQDGTLDQAIERRMTPMAWSPLGGGRLFEAGSERVDRVREALAGVGQDVGLGVAGTAFAFLARHPAGLIPVTGTRAIGRVAEALAGMGTRLTREQFFEIWTASTGSSLD